MRGQLRISGVTPLEGFHVRLELTDGTTKELDLEPYMWGPVFEAIRSDPALFRAVKVDARLGTIAWDNGADLDPDVLCRGLTPAWKEAGERMVQQP
jgi:hypothetical protein